MPGGGRLTYSKMIGTILANQYSGGFPWHTLNHITTPVVAPVAIEPCISVASPVSWTARNLVQIPILGKRTRD
jgi:hypothetical protein